MQHHLFMNGTYIRCNPWAEPRRCAYIYIYVYIYICIYILYIYMVGAKIIKRKLRRTKVRLFTVPCCSIILFYSGRYEKTLILTYSYFFHRSTILVCSIIVCSPIFPTFISFVLFFPVLQLILRKLFYDYFCVTFFSGPKEYVRKMNL